MILRETAGMVGAGLVVGAGLAYGTSSLVDSRLYGVPPQDPLTLGLSTVLLLLVALTAAYLPARRASRLPPTAALRQQWKLSHKLPSRRCPRTSVIGYIHNLQAASCAPPAKELL
jgi:predicted lysophospholipase L1 biosynthesis ABC-type transport system permease subunit